MAKLKGGTYVAGSMTVEDGITAARFSTAAGTTLAYGLNTLSGQANYVAKFVSSGVMELTKSIISDNGSTAATVAGELIATGDIRGASVYIEEDANSSYYLRLLANSGLTANHTLTINTSNADRTLSLGADLTISTAAKTLTGAGTTLTMGGNITTSGAFALTMTLTGTTSVTLPTSSTLAVNNQTMYIGTTAVAINRASAALTLAGVSLSTLTISTTSNRATSAGGTYNGSAATTIYVYEPGQDLETASSPTFAGLTISTTLAVATVNAASLSATTSLTTAAAYIGGSNISAHGIYVTTSTSAPTGGANGDIWIIV